jgi:hypothetical protein
MTIRRLCHEEAPMVEKFLEASSEVPKNFIAAKGNGERTMEATKVNTKKGWKDMKLAIYSKRLRGEGVVKAWTSRTGISGTRKCFPMFRLVLRLRQSRKSHSFNSV